MYNIVNILSIEAKKCPVIWIRGVRLSTLLNKIKNMYVTVWCDEE
jgi:hypothetical protein